MSLHPAAPLSPSRHRRRCGATLGATLLATACATTGSTLGSGVGDAWLDHPPYYAGQPAPEGGWPSHRTGHLPVVFQRGATQAPIFDPTVSPAMQDLLERMTRYLDSLGASVRVVEGGRVSAVTHAATQHPPDVRFGCETVGGAPGGDCVERGDSALGRGPQYMSLSVGRPSPEWSGWMGQVMEDVGVDHVLVITLEVSNYWTRQRGWRGSKVVELGTDHTQELPWLTSLETPVAVLQITGALVGRDGKAVRIGAEGLMARSTQILLSAIGAQELITDEDLKQLSRATRPDMPGSPLVWQVGLRTLVAELTGRADLVDRARVQ